MGDWVIEIWEYQYKDWISLVFRFRDFWSKEVKVSKHKRVDYKRIFYATPLKKVVDDRKRLTPSRVITEVVSSRRLIQKGCL